jgi:hypothetical protein
VLALDLFIPLSCLVAGFAKKLPRGPSTREIALGLNPRPSEAFTVTLLALFDGLLSASALDSARHFFFVFKRAFYRNK